MQDRAIRGKTSETSFLESSKLSGTCGPLCEMPSSVLGKLTEVFPLVLLGFTGSWSTCTGLLPAEGRVYESQLGGKEPSKDPALHFLELACMSFGARLLWSSVRCYPKSVGSGNRGSVLPE